MRRRLAPIVAALAFAAALPAAAETLAITGARILTAGPAGTLEQGVVVIRDGKIVSVGRGAPPAGARVIDASGAVVTPGLFAAGSLLGAVEISALGDDLSVDNPQIGAAFDIREGLDPASTLIPVARTGGLTSAVVLPQPAGGGWDYHKDDGDVADDQLTSGGGGGPRPNTLFAGQGAVIRLNGGEDMVMRGGVGVVVVERDLGEVFADRKSLSRHRRPAEVVVADQIVTLDGLEKNLKDIFWCGGAVAEWSKAIAIER